MTQRELESQSTNEVAESPVKTHQICAHGLGLESLRGKRW